MLIYVCCVQNFFECLNTDFVGNTNICLILSAIYIFIPPSGCVGGTLAHCFVRWSIMLSRRPWQYCYSLNAKTQHEVRGVIKIIRAYNFQLQFYIVLLQIRREGTANIINVSLRLPVLSYKRLKKNNSWIIDKWFLMLYFNKGLCFPEDLKKNSIKNEVIAGCRVSVRSEWSYEYTKGRSSEAWLQCCSLSNPQYVVVCTGKTESW
jgi:hypothetical protein